MQRVRVFAMLLLLAIGAWSCDNKEGVNGSDPANQVSMEEESNKEPNPLSYIASRIGVPDRSPYCLVSQMIGVDLVTVQYYSPSVRGRNVWETVVSNGNVWECGANSATLVSITSDCHINGNPLPKGEYSLYAIPSESSWTIIFNKKAEAWGVLDYDQSLDILRFNVMPVEIDGFYENLTYKFSDIDHDSGSLNLVWAKKKIPLTLEFTNAERIKKNIQSALSNDSIATWDIYWEAAEYCLYSKSNLDDGLKWIDQAIQMEGNYTCHITKSDLLAEKGDFSGAVKELEIAIQGISDLGDENSEPLVVLNAKLDNLRAQL